MSARTESLLEEIKQLETKLAQVTRPGLHFVPAGEFDASVAERRLAELKAQLTQANEALTEGRQILKG